MDEGPRNTGRLVVVLAAFALALAGCVSRSDQLSRVAKDWCLAVRASQVMPVYPPTADLRVGDVFLTTTAIGQERALFENRGFLPLQTHLARLDVLDEITRFYARRPGDGDAFPGAASDWSGAPGVAFPAYTFDLRRGGGLNLALPIHGVPAALGLLASGAASGAVAIADTTTVGLDIQTLQPLVDAWCSRNRAMLAAYAGGDPEATPVYVRVVTRVFRAKRLSVTLEFVSSMSADVAAGARDAVLGGTATVTNATARAVTFDEELPAPMVIGYLAYDCRVLPGGSLSAPMPTYSRVSGRMTAEPGGLDSAGLLTAWYTADERERLPRLESWIKRHLGDTSAGFFVRFMSLDEWDSMRRHATQDLLVPRR